MITPAPLTPPWGAFPPKSWQQTWLRMLHRMPPGVGWRRLALWLRKPLKSSLADIVDYTVWGLRLRLRSRGNLSEQRLLLMPGYLDPLERKILAEELKPGDVFFDIGANIGVYSLWVASSCAKNVRIEAFEPDPSLCSRLSFNLASNGLSQVRLNPVALGGIRGDVTLVVGDGNSGENRIEAAGNPARGVVVPMIPLSSHLASTGIPRIDVMKIDVEGHETEVLEPFFNAAPRSAWPRLLICELVHEKNQALGRLLARCGYVLGAASSLNGIYRLATPVAVII